MHLYKNLMTPGECIRRSIFLFCLISFQMWVSVEWSEHSLSSTNLFPNPSFSPLGEVVQLTSSISDDGGEWEFSSDKSDIFSKFLFFNLEVEILANKNRNFFVKILAQNRNSFVKILAQNGIFFCQIFGEKSNRWLYPLLYLMQKNTFCGIFRQNLDKKIHFSAKILTKKVSILR